MAGRIGIVTGSGLYDLSFLEDRRVDKVETPFGSADVALGKLGGIEVAAIARHGEGHRLLPNMINHRANMMALKMLGASAVYATSVVGALSLDVPLGAAILFDDLYFPENRLPNGELCTVFASPGEDGRGHYIFDHPFSEEMRKAAAEAARELDIRAVVGGTYGHVNGPRFNSRAEIKQLQSAGVVAVSQTSGPEAVLAGELEMAYQLIGYAVDYANGVSSAPTPIDELNANLEASKSLLPKLIERALTKLDIRNIGPSGIMYRF